MHVEDVIARPVNMVRPGPRWRSLAGLAYAAQEAPGDDVIVVDTGGTTFDVRSSYGPAGSSTRGRPGSSRSLVGYLLGVLTVDARSIGAGAARSPGWTTAACSAWARRAPAPTRARPATAEAARAPR
ncbi:MAG: hydantoinase/oxoprolinase family protein [Thermoleophilia bacterium]